MLNHSLPFRAGKFWLRFAAVAAFMVLAMAMATNQGGGAGLAARAQTEPTLNQVYQAANAGQLTEAQGLIQQVLTAHPNSAKAHFVQAELFAKQGQNSRAREALGTAEKLAPGLPFAKADSVQNLRTLLVAQNSPSPGNSPSGKTSAGSNSSSRTAVDSPAAPSSSFPMGLALALGGGAIGLGIYLTRKKTNAPAIDPASGLPKFSTAPAQTNPQMGNPAGGFSTQNTGIGGNLATSTPAMQSGLGGPQSFGTGQGTTQQPYGQPGYAQPGMAPAAGSGLGGKVMGGLAAGLAVGAGVMAAQAIGRSLSGHNEHNNNDHSGYDRSPNQAGNLANEVTMPSASNAGYASNSDLGGQNFGVTDTGSWDDNAVVADNGGGGDWDT